MGERSVALWLVFGGLLVACGDAGSGPADVVELSDVVEAAGDSVDDVAPLAEPVDVLPFARLTASGIHVPAGTPWPREARDAVATVRDGRTDTGWWVPQGAPSWLEIDLAPAFGGPREVEALSFTLEGTPAADATVELSDACGGAVTATLSWADPAVPLALAGQAAACLRVRWTAAADLRVLEAALTSRDGRVQVPSEGVPAEALPAVRHEAHGVVEGFYGVPWSWRERAHLLAFLARAGLTTYVYAPKLDPLHRAEWRTPYPEADLQRFRALAALADDLGVQFLFGISPLIDFDFATDADYDALLAKVRPLVEGGAAGACLLADDIEMEAEVDAGAALGSAHAALANRLQSDLRDVRADARVWFVPTVYSDDRATWWEGAPEYLEALRALDGDVPVLWTGTDTFSSTLGAADLATVTARLGRPPLIWDNFWANDGGDGFFGRLLLGAYDGRAADLAGAIAGLVQNPSIQGAATRLALSTYVAWLADPAGYDPARARVAAAEAELAFAFGAGRSDARDAATLSLLLAIFDASTLDTPRYVALADAVAALTGALADDGLPLATVRPLLALLGRMAALPTELHHSGLDADLVDDLALPVDKVATEGQLGLTALSLLGERLAGREGGAERQAAKELALASKTNRFQQEPRLEEALLAPIAAVEPRAGGFVAPGTGEPPPACRQGEAFAWQPFADADEVTVAGLPGATITGAGVTWTPPHAGHYVAVVAGTRATGWAWRWLDLACD